MKKQDFDTEAGRQKKQRTLKNVLMLVLILGIALVFTGCGDDGDDDHDDPTGPEVADYTITLPGATQWLNTEIIFEAGDEITITASGTVVYDAPDNACGPEGANWTDTLDQQDPLWQQPHAGLIGKIEEAGTPFFIGTSYSFVAGSGGTLFLGINDFWYEGNTGEFSVTIQVTSAS